jgi:hypothetical protein
MLSVTRLKDGTIDLLDLFPSNPQGKKEEKAAPGPPWVFTLGQFAMDQYTVRMRDLSPPTPVSLAVENIRVRGENISTGKGQKGNIALSLLLDRRTTFSTRNILSIDPLRVDGSAEIKRLPFRPYSPYYQDRILFRVEDGELEAQAQYHYSKSEKSSEIRLAELSASLLRLKLQKGEEQEPFLNIPSASLKGMSLDVNKKLSFGRSPRAMEPFKSSDPRVERLTGRPFFPRQRAIQPRQRKFLPKTRNRGPSKWERSRWTNTK